MNFWLLKSEPGTWSWDDQSKVKKEMWDGVRNYQARNNLMKMKKGDLCFFYHSVNEKKIVGIVEVVKEHYPDPTDKTKKFVVVDVKAKKKLRYSESIVGIVEIVKESYPDPTDKIGRFVVVDVKAIKKLKNPVTLGKIKQNKKLQNIALVKQSRLSVMPLKKNEWDILIKMSLSKNE